MPETKRPRGPASHPGENTSTASTTPEGASVKREYTNNGHGLSIQVYQNGVAINGLKIAGNPSGKGGGKRGVVKGWSKSSRKRMREFMLRMRVPEGWEVASVTLTFPGTVPDISEAKAAWEVFRTWVKNQGLCGIWRVEIQKRGALHWHCMIGCDPNRHEGHVKDWQWDLKDAWSRCLDTMTGCYDANGNFYYARSQMPGASVRACVVSWKDSGGAWERYMQDHASKTKQEQIAIGIGRHWGVIRKSLFRAVLPEECLDLTRSEFNRFVRCFQRLRTPLIRCQKAPFGRKVGFRARWGCWGRSVAYTKPETVRRLVAWAKSEAACQ